MHNYRKYISVLLISIMVMVSCTLFAQKWKVQIHIVDKDSIQQLELADSSKVGIIADSIQKRDQFNGYISASIDTIYKQDSSYYIHYFKGEKFTYGQIDFDLNDPFLYDVLYNELREINGKKLHIDKLRALYKKIITKAENSGYPFASIKLDSVSIKNDILRGKLIFNRSAYISIDSIARRGNIKISDSYIYKYLNIVKSQHYDRAKIEQIPSRLKNLSFVNLKKKPQISFINNKAIIHLDLEKKKSSHFDFLIGLLQNNTPEGQKYVISGSFTAEMINKLSFGERLYIKYQRLKAETQELQMAFDYPYIVGSSIGVSFDFELYRDTDSFLDAKLNLGAQYYLSGRNYIKTSWNYKTSRLLQIDTSILLSQKRLPDNLDLQYNGLGFVLDITNLDYIFNPKSGYSIQLSSDVGSKKIIKNNAILDYNPGETLDFGEAYDSLNLNTYQLSLKADISYFYPIANNITIKSALTSAWIYNEEKLFENELFRIGGNRLLRGFDEQSIKSSFYTVFSFELRFILAQQNNNFTLSLPFIDYAFEYNPFRAEGDKWDRPIGVGVGMDFQTPAGLFNFAISAGKRLSNPFDFGNLKIHFGYVNLF